MAGKKSSIEIFGADRVRERLPAPNCQATILIFPHYRFFTLFQLPGNAMRSRWLPGKLGNYLLFGRIWARGWHGRGFYRGQDMALGPAGGHQGPCTNRFGDDPHFSRNVSCAEAPGGGGHSTIKTSSRIFSFRPRKRTTLSSSWSLVDGGAARCLKLLPASRSRNTGPWDRMFGCVRGSESGGMMPA